MDIFPGAIGYGKSTIGGRGGKVLQVTNLNDSGNGSLRQAVEVETGSRFIVFRISGTIELSRDIYVDSPFITIAGQTSPGGIQLKGGGIKIRTHDVVVRGIMARPGDGVNGTPYEARGGISINSDQYPAPYNIIIDHSSFQFGIDENVSTWGNCHDITFSHSIITHGLNNSYHPDGPHSMGLQIGQLAQDITVFGSLIGFNKWRNPVLQEGTKAEVINNLIVAYGAGGIIIQGGQINIIGNDTRGMGCALWKGILIDSVGAGSSIYIDDLDNVENLSTLGTALKSSPLPGSGIIPMPKTDVFEYVLRNAGARNDPLDTKIKGYVRAGKSDLCLIDTPDQLGGYPVLTGEIPVDSNGDGLPDYWSTLNATDMMPSGYMRVEEWANSFYLPPLAFSPIVVTVAYRGKNKNLNIRDRADIYGDTVGVLYPYKRVEVIQILRIDTNNVWGKLGNGMYIPLYYNGAYYTDWR